MGGRIPKSAQRAIDKANRQMAERRTEKADVIAKMPELRVMALGQTPRGIMNMHEVYFNGELQHLCTLANVDKGMIRRWTHGKGNVPAKGAEVVELFGKVEIRRKVK